MLRTWCKAGRSFSTFQLYNHQFLISSLITLAILIRLISNIYFKHIALFAFLTMESKAENKTAWILISWLLQKTANDSGSTLFSKNMYPDSNGQKLILQVTRLIASVAALFQGMGDIENEFRAYCDRIGM